MTPEQALELIGQVLAVAIIPGTSRADHVRIQEAESVLRGLVHPVPEDEATPST